MSLTRLLKSSVKLFQKDAISFLIVRRHDLGVVAEKLRYIAVRPNSSTAALRHKVWFLLELPDYCEELIVLKNHREVEIPLAALRQGNDPTHPYILDVYQPDKPRIATSSKIGNMLTMGGEASVAAVESVTSSNITYEKSDFNGRGVKATSDLSNSQHYRTLDNNRAYTALLLDKKSDLSSRISSSSLINKLHGRKSRDNLTNVLLKLQSDLSNLSNKLSSLETRVLPPLN